MKQTKGKINPAWSLSRDQREKIFSNSGPGPGSYQVPTRIAEGPKYVLGLKESYEWVKHKGEPGPGKYDPRTPTLKTAYTISKT